MAVQFILGRAGCGKSQYCLDQISKHLIGSGDEPIILLLPEQATYQAERAMLNNDKISGYSNLHILSFNRLQFRLSQLSGKNTAGIELSKLGCEMVVQKILSKYRGNLKILSKVSDKQGTAKQIASLITNLHESEISFQEVNETAEKLMQTQKYNVPANKFADIGFVYEKYLEFFEKISPETINPDKRLSEAKKDIHKADFLKNAIVYVDGFASFTQQELELLMEVIKVSRQTFAALCLDPTRVDLANPDRMTLDKVSMFYRTEKTYVDMIDAIRSCKVKIAQPIILNEIHRFNNPALKNIERFCFEQENYQQQETEASDAFVSIMSADNPRDEVDAVAKKIAGLVMDRNWRFRDIAVVMSSPEEYRHYIVSSFTDHEIAFFMDMPGQMSSHPAAELLQSAIKAVCGQTKTSDVMAYLKTDLGPVDREQIYLLENYCIAFGVDGDDWQAKDNWKFSDKKSGYDEKAIDKIRRKAFEPLKKLRSKLNGEITAKDFTKAIFELVEELKIKDKLAQWEVSDPSGIHQQFYHKLVDVFDEMVRVSGEDKSTATDFALILSEALNEMKLKLIPQKLDQVLVGSIERSRHPNIKAVFLVGANQKNFPSAISSGNLLSEEDKTAADANGLDLGDSLLEQLAGRQYLAYIAFTRASDYLHISYACNDSGGKSHTLSGYADEIVRMFDSLTINKYHKDGFISKGTLADDLCRTLGTDSEVDKEEAAAISEKLIDSDIEPAKVLLDSVCYTNQACIDNKALKEDETWFVKDGKISCSTSRLTSFTDCPFRHFAKYMLNLKQRDTMKLEIMDMGSFYHKVLEGVSRELIKDGKDLASTDDNILEHLCKGQITYILENDAMIGGFAKQSAYNNYVITAAYDTITSAIKGYAKASKAGSFKLSRVETEFGFGGGDAECKFTLKDNTEVVLKGVIDRLDVANIDGKLVGLIFDYKLNSRSVSYNKLANKLDMQLPIYMLALKQMRINDVVIDDVAGAFYLPVQVKTAEGDPEKFDQTEKKFEYKAYGLFNGEYHKHLDKDASQWSDYYNFYVSQKDGPFACFGTSGAVTKKQLNKILEFTQNSIEELAENIVTGNISITPYRLGKTSPCSWCEMRAVCRFDWQVNRYNILSKFDKKNWLTSLGVMDEQ